ncbi:hypothetical protein [Mycobacterium marinum]|uniref:hypothetical protein n=1 Tax=Mycobacterium marinum TaxID=1781 RepID=UPI001923099A|nr:hypothetical protein [Mycobacterium marinum]QQW33529.1 hypothetical protein HXW97_06600 [Mycobacterium marinum]
MDDNALRAVSKGLFGNRHKLEVISAIAEVNAGGAPDVYPRMISKMLRVAADNQVGEVFTQLLRGGLLIPVMDKQDAQKHRCRPRESGVWQAALALMEELRDAQWDPGLDS